MIQRVIYDKNNERHIFAITKTRGMFYSFFDCGLIYISDTLEDTNKFFDKFLHENEYSWNVWENP